MLPRLLGTVLCTLARLRRPSTQLVLSSGRYWLVVVLVKVWPMPATVPVVLMAITVGSPTPLNVLVVVTVGNAAPLRSVPLSTELRRYGR